MILISHRGNLNSPDPETENTLEQINKVIDMGYHCEIDVWVMEGKLYLGHDKEKLTEINLSDIINARLWIHCKNIQAVHYFTNLVFFNNDQSRTFHCFFHQNDPIAITSHGYLWTSPGHELTTKSIAVLPELKPNWYFVEGAGICSDYITRYESFL